MLNTNLPKQLQVDNLTLDSLSWLMLLSLWGRGSTLDRCKILSVLSAIEIEAIKFLFS